MIDALFPQITRSAMMYSVLTFGSTTSWESVRSSVPAMITALLTGIVVSERTWKASCVVIGQFAGLRSTICCRTVGSARSTLFSSLTSSVRGCVLRAVRASTPVNAAGVGTTAAGGAGAMGDADGMTDLTGVESAAAAGGSAAAWASSGCEFWLARTLASSVLRSAGAAARNWVATAAQFTDGVVWVRAATMTVPELMTVLVVMRNVWRSLRRCTPAAFMMSLIGWRRARLSSGTRLTRTRGRMG